MTDGLGQLAYRKGGSALAYRKGGGALIFKGEPRLVTVRVQWWPQNYVCRTYSVYHELTMGVETGWSLGDGEIAESVTEGAEFVFKIRARTVPARFFVRLSGSTPCSAASEDPPEIPEMRFSASASQRGARPAETGESGNVCMSAGEVRVDIGKDGTLSGIEVA